MPLQVRLSASLRRLAAGYDPLRGLEADWHPGMTVAVLLTRLGIATQEVKIIMVNGRAAGPDAPLADGDRVGLFPAVGGG